jgi:hypothetical protein
MYQQFEQSLSWISKAQTPPPEDLPRGASQDNVMPAL